MHIDGASFHIEKRSTCFAAKIIKCWTERATLLFCEAQVSRVSGIFGKIVADVPTGLSRW